MFKQINKRIRLLKNKGKEPYLSIYKIVGFYPDNIQLYEQAFLHKSSSIEAGDGKWLNNERLEFLGDAILDSIVADILYKKYPYKREGFLTNTRSKIVQRDSLNRIAVELGIDKMVRFSARLNTHNNHMYGNALEALIGAIYLDQGYRKCFRFIKDVIINRHMNLEKIARKEVNFKSSLIEWSQKNKIEISFDLIESFMDNEGNPVFQTAICLADRQIGIGIGYSKKESQQNAAKMAVKKLRTDKEFQQFVSELKKHNTGELAADQEFDELPDESENNE
ncbi:ribonuclease III [Parabacteroides sp. 52]|uniref:ribonuclease III n=1 Tax=unclassified Parabacteroides TaxID=2649774 RepID=UPI0013D41AE9|nr:ribonuclease III [Parabacteroides sp. PM5-20]MDH6535595.1 ribonuclease-3 [Parabacteroides sp. PM5-20]NDV55460.1 ribonuclease III [Parabacteroides sp. 52]